jgi:hypothetical protein
MIDSPAYDPSNGGTRGSRPENDRDACIGYPVLQNQKLLSYFF